MRGFFLTPSFVAQGINGVEVRGLTGGIKTEENADGGGKKHCNRNDAGVDDHADTQKLATKKRPTETNRNPDHSATQAQGRRFDKKLGKNVAV